MWVLKLHLPDLRAARAGTRLCSLCVIVFAVLLLSPSTAAQEPCTRVPGKWRCRTCGWLNPANATYCLRDRANLDEQRRRFRSELVPLLKVSPKRIGRGDSAVVSWYTSCASRVLIEPDVGEVAPYGSIRVHPAASTTYSIRIESDWSDWMVAPSPLTLEVVVPPPEGDLRLWPAHIWTGDSVFLAWRGRNASGFVIEPGPLHVKAIGQTEIFGIQQNTTFRLSTIGEDAPAVLAQSSVEVRQPPEPPPMADSPPYQELFDQAAPEVFFWPSEPSPERRFTAVLPPAAAPALDRLVAFLNQYTAIHFRVVGMAWEFGPSDRRHDARLQQMLMSRRRDCVADYLLQRGIALERMTRSGSSTLRALSLDSSFKNRATAQPVAGVVFEFAGVPPTIRAEVVPSKITAGEAAYIVWNSRNAEQLRLDPRVGQAEPSGRTRLAPDRDSNYLISARNSYGLTSSLPLSLVVSSAPSHEPVLPPEHEPWPPAEVNDIFFALRSSALSSQAHQLVARAAAWLLAARNRYLRVVITGYTDGTEAPILALQRAEACRRALIDEGAVSSLLISGFSKRPAFYEFEQAANPVAWRAMNRRVQLRVER